MDPSTLMNGNSSSYQPASAAAAAASYNNLTEIWPFPINGGGGGDAGLGMRLAPFRPDLSQFGGCGVGLDRMSAGSEPMGGVVEQRGQRGGTAGGGRKRRETSSGADDDGKTVSTTSSGNAMNDSESKRLRSSGSKYDDDYQNSKCDEGNSAAGKGVDKSSKPPPEPPKDYIHVRARRGQATDSHSLAERARREKISERMKILQDLVPGCNKVIGKALVLDEIINYVQSLQRQVEFLSMKLEAVNSRMNLGMEGYPSKDFGQQAFDPSGMQYASEPMREYSRGSSPEWLHMQLGGGGCLDRQP